MLNNAAHAVRTPKFGRYRVLSFIVAIGLFLSSLAGGFESLVPTQFYDASAVKEIALERDFSGSGGYITAARLFLLAPDDEWRNVITFFLGLLYIYMCTRLQESLYSNIICLLLLVAPILLVLGGFNKDLFLVPVLYLVQLLVLNSRGLYSKVSCIIAVYLAYAFLFRQYYLIIAAMLIIICILRRPSLVTCIFAAGFALIALMLVPVEVLQTLQSPRDFANAHRVGATVLGSRTAFMNPFAVDGVLPFLLNYGYAVFRLNLAFLVDPGVKELFLLINVAAYSFIAVQAVRQRNDVFFLCGALVISHALVLFLFEPDIGSYLRHLSSMLPYLAPVIGLIAPSPSGTMKASVRWFRQ